MKQYAATLLILLACFTIGACKKDNAIAPNLSITGSWELYATYTGWTGQSTYYPAGNGYIIKFTTSTYVIDSVGKIIGNGTYQIVRDTFVVRGGLIGNRIIYDNNDNNSKNFITLSGDTLSFSVDAYDAGGSSYVRR